MTRQLCIALLLLFPMVAACAEDRRNLSVEDVIAGFDNDGLFYFEMLLQDGNYVRAFNKCLSSKPGDPSWIRQHCRKNLELKNAFECAGDNNLTHVWFVYESEATCEEVRQPMKDKMDALRGQ